MAHGFSATRRDGLEPYAERFADAGFGVLLFDYRGFGDSGGEPRQVIDIRGQQDDYRAAIRAARARAVGRPGADRAVRLVVQRRACRDGRLGRRPDRRRDRAGAVRRRPRPAAHHAAASPPRATFDALRDVAGAALGRPPRDDARGRRAGDLRGDDRARGRARLPRDRRRGLALAQRGRRARDAADRPLAPGQGRDRASPARCSSASATPTRRRRRRRPLQMAQNAPRGEIVRYPIGHFDIYLGEAFERAVADQVAFLQRVLAPREAAVAAVAARAVAWNVVIAGGGFGGFYAARTLERVLPAQSARVTLVSEDNFMLYTPLLPGAAAGTLEPRHVVVPLREELRRTDAADRRGDRRRSGPQRPADRAPGRRGRGAAPTTSSSSRSARSRGCCRSPASPSTAIGFRTLSEAIALRNGVLRTLEIAETIEDPAERARLAHVRVRRRRATPGLEGLAELQDFAADVIELYPRCRTEGMRWILVEARDRVMPEISPSLASFATGELRRRGIEIRTGTTLEEVTAVSARLSDGETVPTHTVVWTAGVRPTPVVAELGLELAEGGRLAVDRTLRCTGRENVWAIGDAAAVDDPARRGQRQPADRAARDPPGAARRPQRRRDDRLAARCGRFRYSTRGVFVDMGKSDAVASTMGIRWRGLPGLVPGAHLPPGDDARPQAQGAAADRLERPARCSGATPPSSAARAPAVAGGRRAPGRGAAAPGTATGMCRRARIGIGSAAAGLRPDVEPEDPMTTALSAPVSPSSPSSPPAWCSPPAAATTPPGRRRPRSRTRPARRRRPRPTTAGRPRRRTGDDHDDAATTTTTQAAVGRRQGGLHRRTARAATRSPRPARRARSARTSTTSSRPSRRSSARSPSGGGAMPAFDGQLSPEEIKAVAAYVSSNAGA